MENLFKKNRLLVIDEKGDLFPYEKQIGVLHKECLEKYSILKGYQDSNIETIVNNENIVFYNLSDDFYFVVLPFQINDLQLYMLDYLNDMMDIINMMNVAKINKNKKEEIVLKTDEETTVKEQFSSKIINSYLKTNQIRSL